MSTTYDTSCLYSTVKNTSGGTLTFSYLGEHGRSLANNGTFTEMGDIRDTIARKGARAKTAFDSDVGEQRLTIVSTPSPILFDTVANDSKILSSSGGTVSGVAPCWETSL